jgi:hypothetical protein
MSSKKINAELVPLTLELATHIASLPALPGERSLRPARIKFFEEHLTAGTFAGVTWTIGICHADGKTYRIDGQHTSHTLMNLSAEAFPADLVALIVTYEFDDTELDGAALFDLFDNPRSSRTNEDMMGFNRAKFPDLLDVPLRLCVYIGNGIYDYEEAQQSKRLYPARMRGLYYRSDEYRVFAHWINTFAKDDAVENGNLGWVFTKSGIIAEMLAGWKAAPAMAGTFWNLVLTESHKNPRHLTRLFAEQLKEMRREAKRQSQEAYRLKTQKAWKRFQRDQAIESEPDPSSPDEQPSLLAA